MANYERMTPEEAAELGIDGDVVVVTLDDMLRRMYPDASDEELDELARMM